MQVPKHNTVDHFMAALSYEKAGLVNYLRTFICSLSPEIRCSIRYGTLFFDYKKWMLYINARDIALELCFLDGNDIEGYDAILLYKGRKTVRSITYSYTDDLDIELLSRLILSAMEAQENAKGKKWKKY